MKKALIALAALAAAACTWADGTINSININLCQGTDNGYKVSSTVSTLIGDIPAAAWAQSTANGNHTFSTTTGYDGTSTYTLSGTVSIQENVSQMGNHGQDTSYSHEVLKSWLATKDNMSHSGTLTISNIPFSFYDVIVIMSGATGTTGGFSGKFAPLTITAGNKSATKYAGGDDAKNYNTVVTASDSGWGSRGQNAIEYGTNALRVDGLAGTLTISYTAYAEGIAGVQIIDSTAEHFNVEDYALTHNDGYVRDGVTYNYIFRGTDATYPSNWGTCANWYTRVAPNVDLGIDEEFWSPYTSFSSVSSKNAPQVGTYSSNSYAGTGDDRKSESPYDPALVDGALIDNFDPTTPITMSFCEGWAVKMGVYGGAKVEVNRINKLQSNSNGEKWFHVGEGSKITVKAMGSGTVNNDIKFYVAEPAGFEWQCELSGNSNNGTFQYYLSGGGSVKYTAGLNRGTHQVKSYAGALSEPGAYKKIVVKTLIEMGAGTQMTKTVSFSDATVTFGGVAGTAVSGLALSNDVGSYEFSQDASGAYISYVDYSDEDMGWNVEPGETLVISEAVVDNRKVICDGSFTITGTPSYTVTAADLAKLDFSDVTGTVTLGDYTCYELDTGRTLPAGYVFGAGSAVAMTETVAEYMQDRFSVSGLTGVSTVMLTRYDGTITNLVVTEGSASRGDGSDIKVTGAAALYDFTFTNIVATATGSRNTATMGMDGTPVYDDGVGVVPSPAYPYIGISAMHSWTEFSTVVVGKMPSDNKKCFISFGRGWNNLLFLATGSKANEVVIGYGNSSSVEVLATMTVPHAAESRHLYAFTISENKTKLTIYLDGMKWKTVTRPGGFALATSDTTPGIQIGKGYATNPAEYGSATDGVFYSLLIYDYVLSEAQLEALTELYPYSPSGGSYSRSVSGETTFATEGNTWTKSGDAAANYAVPAGDSAITLTAGQDASVAVNATLSADSLTLDGTGSLTLKKGDGLLTSAGLTTIATDVTIEAGAADISGAPTVFGESGSLCFDYSAYDLFALTGTRLVPLTGEIEEQAEGVVTCLLPDGAFAREHTVEFLYTNGCYQLLVTCRDGRDVYLAAGTTRFEDGTPVIYYEEVPAEPEGGDPELVPHECYAIAADTVHFLAADMVTVARTCPVTGYDFGDFVGTLVFASAEELILNTTITGAGRVKVASGVVQSRGSIATDIDVDDGAILKLGSVSGFGATSGGVTPSGKAINITGTVELNGVKDSCNEFTLNGGTLRNTGTAIPTENRQTTALALTANSTVHAGSDFGLVGSGYDATSLELGNYTLTKTGSANFWLYNTRSTGAGTIDIQAGSVYAYSTVDMPNVNFNVAEGATLKIRTDSFSVGTISGVGTVDFGQNRPTTAVSFAEGSSFDVKIVLASTTESSVRINYTGPQPNSVTVCEPSGNWDVVSTAATVSHEPGCIVVTVDVADTRRRNPAVDGDQATFTNIFMGDQDATWETIANWKVSSNNRWADYGGSLAPCLTDSNYDAVLFDGDLMKVTPGADGYKSVGVTTRLEGWTLRVGLFNHVKVSAINVKKQQGNCFYMVDATSKLIMNENNKSKNNGGKVTFYVAAKDGVEFTGDFDFGGTDGVEYYFKGEGSVNYTAGNTHGSHAIKGVASLQLGRMSATKRIFRHKLVSFSGSSTKTFTTDSVSVAGFKVNKAGEEETVAMTVKSAAEGEPAATLNAATDDVGTCVFVQDSTGVYIDYVGYSAPFFIYLR